MIYSFNKRSDSYQHLFNISSSAHTHHTHTFNSIYVLVCNVYASIMVRALRTLYITFSAPSLLLCLLHIDCKHFDWFQTIKNSELSQPTTGSHSHCAPTGSIIIIRIYMLSHQGIQFFFTLLHLLLDVLLEALKSFTVTLCLAYLTNC